MIRPATHADVAALTTGLAHFFDAVELTDSGLTPDMDTIEFFIRDSIDEDHRCFLVAECDGNLVGGITGVVAPWMWNANILTLVELGWFVPKEYRKQYPVAAMQLRKRFHQWGKDMGATVLCMSSTKREESPRVIQMYEKSGLRHLDSNFVGRL